MINYHPPAEPLPVQLAWCIWVASEEPSLLVCHQHLTQAEDSEEFPNLAANESLGFKNITGFFQLWKNYKNCEETEEGREPLVQKC